MPDVEAEGGGLAVDVFDTSDGLMEGAVTAVGIAEASFCISGGILIVFVSMILGVVLKTSKLVIVAGAVVVVVDKVEDASGGSGTAFIAIAGSVAWVTGRSSASVIDGEAAKAGKALMVLDAAGSWLLSMLELLLAYVDCKFEEVQRCGRCFDATDATGSSCTSWFSCAKGVEYVSTHSTR